MPNWSKFKKNVTIIASVYMSFFTAIHQQIIPWLKNEEGLDSNVNKNSKNFEIFGVEIARFSQNVLYLRKMINRVLEWQYLFNGRYFFFFSLIIIRKLTFFKHLCDALCAIENDTSCSVNKWIFFFLIFLKSFLTSRVCF